MCELIGATGGRAPAECSDQPTLKQKWLAGGPALPFTELTLEELSRRQPPGASTPDRDDMVPGMTMSWGRLLDSVNELERTMTAHGWTLRKPAQGATPILLEATVDASFVAVNPSAAPGSGAGGLAGFTDLTSPIIVGDKSYAAVEIEMGPKAANQPNAWNTSSTISAHAYLSGQEYAMADLGASSTVPVSLGKREELRRATGGVTILGAIPVTTTVTGATSDDVSIDERLEKTAKRVAASFRFYLGPFPFTVKLGFDVNVGAAYRASANDMELKAGAGPSVGADLFAEALAGVDGILSFGPGGSIEYLRLQPQLFSDGRIELDAVRKEQCMTWNPALGFTISTGRGTIYLTGTFTIPGLDPFKFSIAIATTQGRSENRGVELLLPIGERVCRPQPCEGNKTQCAAGCFDFATDSQNCGGCGIQCTGATPDCAGSCTSCMSVSTLPGTPSRKIGFSCRGPIPGMQCISLADPKTPAWSDNYFCVEAGQHLYSWWNSGPPTDPQLSCVNVLPLDGDWAERHGWSDNFICSRSRAGAPGGLAGAWDFSWSRKGAIPNEFCVPWLEPTQPQFGLTNYLCMH